MPRGRKPKKVEESTLELTHQHLVATGDSVYVSDENKVEKVDQEPPKPVLKKIEKKCDWCQTPMLLEPTYCSETCQVFHQARI